MIITYNEYEKDWKHKRYYLYCIISFEKLSMRARNVMLNKIKQLQGLQPVFAAGEMIVNRPIKKSLFSVKLLPYFYL